MITKTPVLTALLAAAMVGHATAQSSPLDQPNKKCLYGRVILKGRPPMYAVPDPYIKIVAHYQGDAKSQDASTYHRDIYCCRVLTPSKLDLVFCRDGYQSAYTDLIRVKGNEGMPMPDVPLDPLTAKGEAVSSDKFMSELTGEMNAERLTADSRLALFNIETLRQRHPELADTFQRFSSSPRVQKLFEERTDEVSLYDAIIANNTGAETPINTKALLQLIQDEGTFQGTFPGIRARALETAAVVDFSAADKSALLSYLRAQSADPDGMLLRPARLALVRMGTAADKAWITGGLSSTNKEEALASIIAVGKARLAAARSALTQLAGRTDIDPEIGAAAKMFLDGWEDDAQQFTTFQDLWGDGGLNPDVQMQANTSTGRMQWFEETADATGPILAVSYPGDPSFGYVQFLVRQTGNQKRTLDFSRFSALIIEIRSDEPGHSVKIGLKGEADPENTILFEPSITNVPTTWKRYVIPLRGKNADEEQPHRLQTLKVPTQLSFSGTDPQHYYIRRLYFAGP